MSDLKTITIYIILFQAYIFIQLNKKLVCFMVGYRDINDLNHLEKNLTLDMNYMIYAYIL